MRRGARRCAASGGRDEGESLFGRRTGVGREGSAGEPGRLGPGLGGGWGRGSRSALHAPAPGRGRRAGPATGGRCLRPGEGR